MFGIPGTGIGGLFYMFLSLILFIRESYRRCSRARNRAFWPVAKTQIGIIGGVVTALFLLDWFLTQFFSLPVTGGIFRAESSGGGVTIPPVIFPAVLLFAVLVFVEFLALFARGKFLVPPPR